MKRGDIFTAAGGGDFLGQPRPALIVQGDLFLGVHPSITMCPISSHITGDHLYRVLIERASLNGLRLDSEVEVDKVTTIWVRKVGTIIGQASGAEMFAVDAALRRWLGL